MEHHPSSPAEIVIMMVVMMMMMVERMGSCNSVKYEEESEKQKIYMDMVG